MAEQIITKSCRVCKKIKPLSEFPKNRSKKSGYNSECNTCCNKYYKEYRQTEKGKVAHHKANKKYRKTKKGKAVNLKSVQRFNVRHPNQTKAVRTVNHAIRNGKLIRPNTQICHYCPAKAEQYHHHLGYEPEHWLDVIPVCIKCHQNPVICAIL